MEAACPLPVAGRLRGSLRSRGTKRSVRWWCCWCRRWWSCGAFGGVEGVAWCDVGAAMRAHVDRTRRQAASAVQERGAEAYAHAEIVAHAYAPGLVQRPPRRNWWSVGKAGELAQRLLRGDAGHCPAPRFGRAGRDAARTFSLVEGRPNLGPGTVGRSRRPRPCGSSKYSMRPEGVRRGWSDVFSFCGGG